MKKIGFINQKDELRVPLYPDSIDKYISKEIKIYATKNIFSNLNNPNHKYKNLNIVSENELLNSDILCSVNPIDYKILEGISKPTKIVGMYEPKDIQGVEKFANKELLEIYSFFNLPRISRAQNMDALSSQANLLGYAAVLYAANTYPKVFPMMTTAAGTLFPVIVTILGVGVAGLQGIATAKRLGAQVWAYDIRAEVEEQVMSLGGKFIKASLDTHEEVYAKELSSEEAKNLQEDLLKQLEKSDIVLTFAQIPGKEAPKLISKKMLRNMKNGCLIIDTAAGSGGNCESTIKDKVVNQQGVLIDGNTKILDLVNEDASRLYSENVRNFVELLSNDEKDEIVSGSKMYPLSKEQD